MLRFLKNTLLGLIIPMLVGAAFGILCFSLGHISGQQFQKDQDSEFMSSCMSEYTKVIEQNAVLSEFIIDGGVK